MVDQEEAFGARLRADVRVSQRLLLIFDVDDRGGVLHGRMTSPRMKASHRALFCSVVKRAMHSPSEWTA